jgi:hypothetical protein
MLRMETAFEVAFVAGFVVVFASAVALLTRRVRSAVLLWATGALVVATGVAVALAGLNFDASFVDRPVTVLTAAGLAAAALAEAGLYALSRGLDRLRDEERLLASGRETIERQLEEHARIRADELGNMLARERANAVHELGKQERKLALERRDLLARQADAARAELAKSIELVQERLEQRLTAWAADLDRGQRALETRLNELAHRQSEAINAYEARLAADSEFLQTISEEQQTALARLRTELQKVGRDILEEGRGELEAHADERRRGLADLTKRLRDQEKELRDHLEREQGDALGRITNSFAEVERRQRENLERLLDRAAARLSEDAERRFDAQIRKSREKSAQRLSNELEKALEQFARQAEKEIAERIADAAQATAARVERRVAESTRVAESQHEIAADRMTAMNDRLEDALAAADRRIAEFEERIEHQVATRLQQLEQSIRTPEL